MDQVYEEGQTTVLKAIHSFQYSSGIQNTSGSHFCTLSRKLLTRKPTILTCSTEGGGSNLRRDGILPNFEVQRNSITYPFI